MKSRVQFLLILLLVSMTITTYCQTTGVALDNDRKAWLGINVGAFWQNSDVKSAFGSGSGLTFDYYFIRNTTSIFGIGLRGQYLKATSLGLGVTKDYNIQSNTSLNGSFGNPDYASLATGKNYVYQNHSTDISDLSGNVILSLNRLRAISRIHLYVFGGIGGTGYIAKMDQLDGAGLLYNYDGAVNSSMNTFIKKDLRKFRDGTYETFSEKGNKRAWTLTPTLGAGFSIQLSSRVQLGLEHKIGFTRTDLLDGNRWGTANSRNDVYHYSSLGVNISFGPLVNGRLTGRNRNNVNSTYTYQSTNPQVIQPSTNAPVIRITSPASPQVTLENCVASITALIENIQTRQAITVTQNGFPIAFTLNGNAVTVSDISFTGTANFVITATNASGTATKSVSFVCQLPRPEKHQMITICHRTRGTENQSINIPLTDWPVHASHGDTQGACPAILPPVVTITSPTTSPRTLENCVASATANVENIKDKKDISVTQNGSAVDFEFDGNKVLVSNIAFTETAEIIIAATNSAGTTSQYVSFICKPKMITICHLPPGNNENPQTITIPESAWDAHAAHGDTQGVCPVIQTPEDEEKKRQEDELKKQREAEEKRRQLGTGLKKLLGEEMKILINEGLKRQREDGEKNRQAEEMKKQREDQDRKRQAEEVKKQQEEDYKKSQAEELKKRKDEEEKKRQEDELKKNENEDKIRQAEELKKKEDEEKKRQEDELKKNENEDKIRQAEELRKKEDEDKKRQEDELKKKEDEDKKRQEEELKKKEDEDKKRQEEELKKKEDKKHQEDELKKKEDEDKKRQEDELKKKEDEDKKRQEEELKKKEDEDKKRQAEELKKKEDEDKKRQEDELKKKDEEDKKRKEEEMKKKEEENKSKNEEKITICHYPPGNKENPQTITISLSAWAAHEAHGDTKGSCKD